MVTPTLSLRVRPDRQPLIRAVAEKLKRADASGDASFADALQRLIEGDAPPAGMRDDIEDLKRRVAALEAGRPSPAPSPQHAPDGAPSPSAPPPPPSPPVGPMPASVVTDDPIAAIPDFGAAVRDARKARGWSQEQLGEEIGVTGAAIGLIEKGRGTKPENRAKLVAVLELADV